MRALPSRRIFLASAKLSRMKLSFTVLAIVVEMWRVGLPAHLSKNLILRLDSLRPVDEITV